MASVLDQFVAKNPAYQSWPQDKLLERLHSKYYANENYDSFVKRATAEQPSTDINRPPEPPVQSTKPAPYDLGTNFIADVKRAGPGIARGALEGAADLVNTMITPEGGQFGQQDILDKPLTAARDWLRSVEPAPPPPPKNAKEAGWDIAANVVGGLPAGVIEWTLGVPFAALHGVKTAEDVAHEQGRHATAGEMAWDSLIEGGLRKLLGNIVSRPMGRMTKAAAFGGLSGVGTLAEHKDEKQAAVDAAINAVVGFIGPNISKPEMARVTAAREAVRRGDLNAATNELNPVLLTHSDTIAAAARQGMPEIAPEERLATPAKSSDIKTREKATLALRIAARERADAVSRARMAGWEDKFAGMPDQARIALMSAYQQFGTPFLREEWKPFFRDVEKILSDQAAMEHQAGFDYNERLNYLPGYWQDPNRAKAVLEASPQAGDRAGAKPGFMRPKAFEDYAAGVEAGLVPRTTNPAVIAAMRIEAGNRAIMRHRAMQDMVADGLAVPVGEADAAKAAAKASGMRPSQYYGWHPMDVAGKRYLVHPTAEGILKRALSYDAQQFSDLAGLERTHPVAKAERGLMGKWMAVRNATIPLKLSLSAFHALHMLGIDVAQPVAATLTQALNRRMSVGDFISLLKHQWSREVRDEQGRKVAHDWSKPMDQLSPTERLEQNLFIAGGMSPEIPSIYELRAKQDYRRTINDVIPSLKEQATATGWDRIGKAFGITGEYARLMFDSVGRITEALQGPLFNEFIPQIKAAAYLNEAKTLLASRPDLLEGTPEANAALRVQLRRIANSIDSRFGMFQYEKLFMPTLLKRGLFSTFLSVGWNYGFLREFGGGLFVDLPRLVLPGNKAREITSRTIYASTYLFLGTVVAGLMTALFTGKPPSEPKDFVYPKLPDGTRINTMFFNREFGAIYYHIAQEGVYQGLTNLIDNKMAPSMSTLLEVLHNEDYFGNQIYDPNAPFWDQVQQGLSHFGVGSLAPISIASIQKPGIEPSEQAMSFAGFGPAPKYIDLSPVQSEIIHAYESQHPSGPIPYAETQRVNDLRSIKQHFKAWLTDSQPSDYQAWQQGLADYIAKYPSYVQKGQVQRSMKAWTMPEYASLFRTLDRTTQLRILLRSDPSEVMTYLPYANQEVQRQYLTIPHITVYPAPKTPPVQGARQAPDGKWYMPDPSRPGKYLMVH